MRSTLESKVAQAYREYIARMTAAGKVVPIGQMMRIIDTDGYVYVTRFDKKPSRFFVTFRRYDSDSHIIASCGMQMYNRLHKKCVDEDIELQYNEALPWL